MLFACTEMVCLSSVCVSWCDGPGGTERCGGVQLACTKVVVETKTCLVDRGVACSVTRELVSGSESPCVIF